jgi:outer membrane protein
VIKRGMVGAVILLIVASVVASTQDIQSLSLRDAEQRALQNHPQIRAVQYAAMAADENVVQARSAYYPTVYGSVTGAEAQSGSRIAAGGLNNPIILDRFAAGFSIGQLITDFGRTHDLVQSFGLRADSQRHEIENRRADVLLQVDRAYFNALRAEAVLRVARQTVDARQLVADQIKALAASGLKSGLDLSFANVNLSEARLLLVQAENDLHASHASLSAVLGLDHVETYELSEEPLPGPPSDDISPLVSRALRDRPDVVAQRFSVDASRRFADAERSLWMPAISLVGAAGFTPYHQIGLNDRYSAAGVNITLPVANGNLFSARHAEVLFRAQSQDYVLRDLQNRVSRDVTVAWLDARAGYQRLDLANQLVTQATSALDLAETRYNLGLSSIVELTQAQLNKTRADIEQASARYEYQARTAALRYQIGDLK